MLMIIFWAEEDSVCVKDKNNSGLGKTFADLVFCSHYYLHRISHNVYSSSYTIIIKLIGRRLPALLCKSSTVVAQDIKVISV